MTTPAKLSPRMTVDEYLAWAEAEGEGRFELVDGEVVAMAPERLAHIRTKVRAVNALQRAIDVRGLGCEAIGDGAGVRVADDVLYQPDALVRCGPPLPGEERLVPDPLIVVEVLSPSTKAVDTGAKLGGYFTVPSLRHYLVLDPRDRRVIHYWREAEDGPMQACILHARPGEGADLALDPPGLLVPCEALFEAP